MVKYGSCKIRCLGCGYNKENRESINSDYGRFKVVLSESCQHFSYNISALTRNTFTPVGDPDEITYEVIICCQRCGTPHSYSCGATRCRTNSDSWSTNCCGAGHQVEIKLISNSPEDLARNVTNIFKLFR